MKLILKATAVFFLLLSITGCSRKKNTFLSRNWHAVTAEYNTLYNGNLALELGKEALHETYQDNYWDILPVERMQVRESVMAPGENINPNFAVAEEKAVKAIQRHSMLLEGSEKNPQIDEAYLLLGKARYFDQRFVPALEAFNYILHKYPLSNSINEARIWREKTNMRLEFNELAIRNLKRILEDENLDEDNRAEASASLAQAYLNIGAKDSATVPITRAAELTDDKKEEGRYWYILGQLYDNLGKTDSAGYAFEKVVDLNRKTPRIYLINAYLRQMASRELSAGAEAEILRELNSLAEDRENRPYLDQIYFELAEFHFNQDSTNLAMDYYNKSLRTPSQNLYLQSLDYESLGNINFDAANFEIAGAYYDSTLQKLASNSREYRLIRRKRDNLNDVIFYENVARKNDSVLYVAHLPEEKQREFFTSYIEELRLKAENAPAQADQKQQAQEFFETKRPSMPGIPTPGSTFYFYNPTTVAYGKQEFARIWGERELVNNWRTQKISRTGIDLAVEGQQEVISNNPVYDVQTYLSKIPKEVAVLERLQDELNYANYQLGLIYREKFRENELAAEKLELVLASQPEERLIIPSKYHLYKIYTEIGAQARAQGLKNDIIFQYPESRYAAILKNPGSLLRDENNPTALYEELYGLYEKQEFKEVIAETNRLIEQFQGDEIVPKLELLKVMAEGRLRGFKVYKQGLNYVALNYPQSEEGKKAQQLLTTALPSMERQIFHEDSPDRSYKLIFQFDSGENGTAESFKSAAEELLREQEGRDLTISRDVYDEQQEFVVIHGFSSPQRAMELAEVFKKDLGDEVQKNYFYISNSNYRIAQIHKNINTYIKLLNKTP